MGLTTPFLIAGLVVMLDIGLAVNERMELDRNVRAGVHAVMARVTEPDDIESAIEASAGGSSGITIDVSKVCSCGNTVTACTNWCSGSTPPSVVINIKATKPQTGFMLPELTLESESHVQLR